MTGQSRDLQAEQDHAEFIGWLEANGFNPDPDMVCGSGQMRDAFMAGMQAARDLAPLAPLPDRALALPATSAAGADGCSECDGQCCEIDVSQVIGERERLREVLAGVRAELLRGGQAAGDARRAALAVLADAGLIGDGTSEMPELAAAPAPEPAVAPELAAAFSERSRLRAALARIVATTALDAGLARSIASAALDGTASDTGLPPGVPGYAAPGAQPELAAAMAESRTLRELLAEIIGLFADPGATFSGKQSRDRVAHATSVQVARWRELAGEGEGRS